MVTGSDPGTEPSKTRLTRCLTHITSRRYNDDLQYSIALEAPAPCYEGKVAVDPWKLNIEKGRCMAWVSIKRRKFRNQVSHLEMNGSLIHGQQPCSRISVVIFRCKTWRCSKRTPLWNALWKIWAVPLQRFPPCSRYQWAGERTSRRCIFRKWRIIQRICVRGRTLEKTTSYANKTTSRNYAWS